MFAEESVLVSEQWACEFEYGPTLIPSVLPLVILQTLDQLSV